MFRCMILLKIVREFTAKLTDILHIIFYFFRPGPGGILLHLHVKISHTDIHNTVRDYICSL